MCIFFPVERKIFRVKEILKLTSDFAQCNPCTVMRGEVRCLDVLELLGFSFSTLQLVASWNCLALSLPSLPMKWKCPSSREWSGENNFIKKVSNF